MEDKKEINKKKEFIARTRTIKPQEAWHFALDLKVKVTLKNRWVFKITKKEQTFFL